MTVEDYDLYDQYIDTLYTDEDDEDAELSERIARLDSGFNYSMHRGMWWNSDSSTPLIKRSRKEGYIRMAIPIAYKNAPTYILDEIVIMALTAKDNLSGLPLSIRPYLQAPQHRANIRSLMGLSTIERLRSGPLYDAKTVAEQHLRDRRRLVDDVIVMWRDPAVDSTISPICTTNLYGRVILVDPVLRDSDFKMLAFAVYHEMAAIAALGFRTGRPKATKFRLLEERFQGSALMLTVFDAMGWRFTYDTRATPDNRSKWPVQEYGEKSPYASGAGSEAEAGGIAPFDDPLHGSFGILDFDDGDD